LLIAYKEKETAEASLTAARENLREAEDAVRAETGTVPPESATDRKTKTAKSATPALADPNIEQIREDLQYRLGTQVSIHDRQGEGRIEIGFYSYDDLNRIYRLLSSGKAS